MADFKAVLYSWYEVEIKLDANSDFIIKVNTPVWANWVTIDEAGEIYGFEIEPTLVEGHERTSWWWAEGKKKYIDYTDAQEKSKVPTLLFKIEKEYTRQRQWIGKPA